MPQTIIFKPDVGVKTGMGHLIRSLALAEYLSGSFDICFSIPREFRNLESLISPVASKIIEVAENEKMEIDQITANGNVVVLDGYKFSSDFQKQLKDKKLKVVCIDDIHSIHFFADVIINPQPNLNPGVYSKEFYTKVFTGPEYILLREPFPTLALTPGRVINSVQTIFINMGGSDSENITERVIDACLKLEKEVNLLIVLGALNTFRLNLEEKYKDFLQIQFFNSISSLQIAELLSSSELAVLPSSSICYEAFCVGVGVITGYTAQNQLGNVDAFEKLKVVNSIGDFSLVETSILIKEISSLVNSPEQINEQICRQKLVIDGKSKERILNVFKELTC